MAKLNFVTSDLILTAYRAAESLCTKQRGIEALHLAHSLAAKGERQHRALGRRMVGRIRPRATVDQCAMLFALRGFFTPKKERSFDAREDFVAAFKAAEQCSKSCRHMGCDAYTKLCKQYRKAILAINYVDLIEGAK